MNELDSVAELVSKLAAELSIKLDRRHPTCATYKLTRERTCPRTDLKKVGGMPRLANSDGGMAFQPGVSVLFKKR